MSKLNSRWSITFSLLVLGLVVSACIPGQQVNINQFNDPVVKDQDGSGAKDDQIDDDATMQDVDKTIEEEGEMIKQDGEVSYSGKALAGEKSLVLEFNQDDYNKALASGKIVLLYFYANWCPVCIAEVPKMYDAFNELDNSRVVAFRVNFKDNETDANEVSLAQQFGVAYQHTKIILQDGARILKAPDSWDKERYLSEVNKLLN